MKSLREKNIAENLSVNPCGANWDSAAVLSLFGQLSEANKGPALLNPEIK